VGARKRTEELIGEGNCPAFIKGKPKGSRSIQKTNPHADENGVTIFTQSVVQLSTGGREVETQRSGDTRGELT